MSNANNKLGRGLSSLLGEKKLNLSSGLINFDLNSNKVQELSIKSLKPNRFQPRKYFNEDELRELREDARALVETSGEVNGPLGPVDQLVVVPGPSTGL